MNRHDAEAEHEGTLYGTLRGQMALERLLATHEAALDKALDLLGVQR